MEFVGLYMFPMDNSFRHWWQRTTIIWTDGTEQQTNRQTDKQMDIITYRVAHTML